MGRNDPEPSQEGGGRRACSPKINWLVLLQIPFNIISYVPYTQFIVLKFIPIFLSNLALVAMKREINAFVPPPLPKEDLCSGCEDCHWFKSSNGHNDQQLVFANKKIRLLLVGLYG